MSSSLKSLYLYIRILRTNADFGQKGGRLDFLAFFFFTT